MRPHIVVFDTADTLFDASTGRAFPDVKPIFLELRRIHRARIVVLDERTVSSAASSTESVMRFHFGAGSASTQTFVAFEELEFVSVGHSGDEHAALLSTLGSTLLAAGETPDTNTTSAGAPGLPFRMMFVSACMDRLQKVQSWSRRGVLCVQARQARGAKGLTPAAVLAPFRHGWPSQAVETRQLPLVLGTATTMARDARFPPPIELVNGKSAAGSGGVKANEPLREIPDVEMLARQLRDVAKALILSYAGRCPVFCTVLRHDDFGFCFAADLIRLVGRTPGFHADLAYLPASGTAASSSTRYSQTSFVAALDGLQEREAHPDKWRGRDVVLFVGCLSTPADFDRLADLTLGLKKRMCCESLRCVALFACSAGSPRVAHPVDAAHSLFHINRDVGASSDTLFPAVVSAAVRAQLGRARVAADREMVRQLAELAPFFSGHGTSASPAAENAATVALRSGFGSGNSSDVGEILLDAETELPAAVLRLAEKVVEEACETQSHGTLVLVGVLRGGFFLHADLVRAVEDIFRQRSLAAVMTVEFDWARVSTYNKQSVSAGVHGSTGRWMLDVDLELSGKHVVLVDDSIASGGSMRLCCEMLQRRVQTGRITCAALLAAYDVRPSSGEQPLFGCNPAAPPVYSLTMDELVGNLGRRSSNRGSDATGFDFAEVADPFSILGGYGNDALSKFRILPDIVALLPDRRDAVWAEDTFAGGVDWRLFCGEGSSARRALNADTGAAVRLASEWMTELRTKMDSGNSRM